jgi:NodT family efflux transporter outer membrane factor (OMF) lipoprotein
VRGVYALPFDVGYQADVWGSIHRGIAANADIAQASAAQLANARLLFQTQLAADYFQLRGSDSDRQILTAAVKSYQEYLDLTRNRFEGGVASMSDVALAETQLETTRAQLVDLGVQRDQLEHAIAILTGKPPANLSIPQSPLTAEPPAIPLSMPSVLLERRPDIAAAERQAGAANEQIGIAMAALYPSLSISASAGLQSFSLADWFTWPSRFWSVGPQLAQTLFDSGRRRAQITLSEAAYDVTVANYRQTVLTAFQQVEDNLAALRILSEEADVEARAVKAAADSLNLSTVQYQGGVVSYLQVITSQTLALQDQRTANDILTRRLTASVLLIEALGGGWDASQLPTAQELTAGK